MIGALGHTTARTGQQSQRTTASRERGEGDAPPQHVSPAAVEHHSLCVQEEDRQLERARMVERRDAQC